jgi:hypothetical protein
VIPGTLDELFEQARPVMPFSNSDHGMSWMSRWCDRCVHDRPARQGREGEGCSLVLVGLMGRTPAQWLTPDGVGDYHCIEFRGEDDGPGPEPTPIPDPPGQLALFDRAPFEGVRMFADVVAEVSVQTGAGVDR